MIGVSEPLPLGRHIARTAGIELESHIAHLTGHRSAIITASGSTAILLALRVIGGRHGVGEVLLPATVCFSVVQAVVFAGFNPVFADVTVPACTIDAEEVERLAGEQTRAIIPVHVFGNDAGAERIRRFASQQQIAVIEDVAQATGGTDGTGAPLGNSGDFAIHSFGRAKVIDATAGGAFSTNDEAAVRLALELQDRFPVLAPEELMSLERRERTIARGAVNAMRAGSGPDGAGRIGPAAEEFRALFERRPPPAPWVRERIEIGLAGLAENLERRRTTAGAYRDALAGLEEQIVTCSDWENTGVVWRYTLMFRDAMTTQAVTDELRRANLHASNLYWSAADLLSGQELRVADRIGRGVLNLWVDAATSYSDVAESARIIRKALSRTAPVTRHPEVEL